MHLGIPALLAFYRQHKNDDSLVLVTIIATEGSTYRKPGAMMLIARDGSFEGMISGGCLEGDLLQHAAGVFDEGGVRHVSYDMQAGDDLVWSLGLGCDGVIHLQLQRLDKEGDFGFLERLDCAQSNRQAGLVALVTRCPARRESGSPGFIDAGGRVSGAPELSGLLKAAALEAPDWRCKTRSARIGGTDCDVLLVNLPVQTRVLICGAGPDAVPVATALATLDWDIHIVDHRPAFAKQERFPANCRVRQARPERLAEVLDAGQLDAAVIMSHHLENDAAYLRQLAAFDIPYLGVLGPAARRGKLSEMAACSEERLFGPVGLDIGAELPQAIALSIAAEIHAVLNGRNGQSLTLRAPLKSDSGLARELLT